MPEAPRGTVTFLCSDIEHSIRLLQHLGIRYAEVLATYRRLLRDAFQVWDGYEIDTAGDGFFVAFQRATHAIAAAVAAIHAHWPAIPGPRAGQCAWMASLDSLVNFCMGPTLLTVDSCHRIPENNLLG